MDFFLSNIDGQDDEVREQIEKLKIGFKKHEMDQYPSNTQNQDYKV